MTASPAPEYSRQLIAQRREKSLEVEKFFRRVEFGQGVQFSKQSPMVSGGFYEPIVSVPTDRPVTGPAVNEALSESSDFPDAARVFRGVVFEAAEFVGGGLAWMLAEMVPETSEIVLVALEDDDEERDLFGWAIVEIPQKNS